MLRYLFAALLLSALSLSACSGTRITHLWSEKDFTQKPFRNYLVVGVADSEAIRRSFEDSFVSALQQAGVEAATSFRQLPSVQILDKDAIIKAVQQLEFDAVLITHLVGVEERKIYHPPRTRAVPTYYDGIYPSYSVVYIYVHEPGYYRRYKVVRMETNLYDVSSQQLVWTARSESLDPDSELKLIEEVIVVITPELKKAGFLP